MFRVGHSQAEGSEVSVDIMCRVDGLVVAGVSCLSHVG